MGLKVAVVGAGSTYTPELVEGIARRTNRLPIDELALLDPDRERLEVVGGLARRMLARGGWPGRLTLTDRRDEALDGAGFVLVQLRVGGQAARLVDETLPVRFGTIGQETTGAGGFAKALRTVPVVLDIADHVRRRSAPGAWIVDFTNPVGMVTQALLDAGHRAVGLCNIGVGLERRFASLFEVAPDAVELAHAGLNHLSWERAVRIGGVDRLDEILEREGAEMAAEIGMPLDEMRRLHVIPSSYLRYFLNFDAVLEQQRSTGHSRAAEVAEIERGLLDLYRDPALDTKPVLLERRGGAFYSEAAAALIASLHDGRGDRQVVNVRNHGAIPDLPSEWVVEVTAAVDVGGAHPLPVAPLAPELHDLVSAVKRYELLTISAAQSGDRAVALEALEANPLVGGRTDVAARGRTDVPALLDALLAANERHLPAFFSTR